MLGNFLKSTDGNIAIMTGLSALVLVGAGGVAVDYVRMNDENTAYTAAADAASLAGAAIIRANPDWKDSKMVAQAESEARKSWKANLLPEQFKLIKKPKIDVTKKGEEWSVKVSYEGKLQTSLLNAVGITTMPVKGEAIAAAGTQQTYWEFDFAIDTSSSMGIGATQSVMNKMKADPNIGCMFACHYSTTGDDTFNKARAAGYKLRLDVVDEAVDATVDDILTKKSIKPRGALYGLTKDIEELVAPTTDLLKIKNHDIQVAYSAASIGNTNYTQSINTLTGKVGDSGDGTSSSQYRKIVILVTDGIRDTDVWDSDVATTWSADHYFGTINASVCDTMKKKGVVVGVLYINYIVPDGYESAIADYKDDILPRLKDCASDGFFYNAQAEADVKKAMKDIVNNAFASDVRLTQ